MKRKMKKIKNHDEAIKWVKFIATSLITAAIGFGISWLFEGKIVLSIIIFSILAIIAIALFVFSKIYEKRVSILSILQDDIHRGKYEAAVKLGYSVSRALFLAGRYDDRYKISEKVCDCLEKIDDESIKINDQTENVALLRIKTKMDDLGWSLFLMNPLKYRLSAESKVKEALNECVGSVSGNESQLYKIVFTGLRHLFGMCVDAFDEDLHNCSNDIEAITQYENDTHFFGEMLGYLIDDDKMFDIKYEQRYITNFKSTINDLEGAETLFLNLKNWIGEKKHNNDNKFFQGTYNFRAKYFLTLARIYRLQLDLDPSRADELNEKISEYLDQAKDYAMRMTVGYAENQEDYKWLRDKKSFNCNIDKIESGCVRVPDNERYVKGYVLLGTIAMQYDNIHYLRDAKSVFLQSVDESKQVNRTDTYLRSQRKLISVEERLFRKKLKQQIKANKLLDDMLIADILDDLSKLISTIDRILKETKDHIGAPDPKMVENCKLRKKEYKKIKRKILNKTIGDDI